MELKEAILAVEQGLEIANQKGGLNLVSSYNLFVGWDTVKKALEKQ